MGLERCETCGTWWEAEFPLVKCPKCWDHVESDPFQDIKQAEPEKKAIFTQDRIKLAGKVLLAASVVILIGVGIYMKLKGRVRLVARSPSLSKSKVER